ncbi:MAG: ABC transporter ATP-binding protein [Cyanobacteria bacterium SW_5_48_44]|jgi:peptide/nickel transport system ATP-binding protein|nr:MAG: ABC transporter ATP-binding protein [Cyanobacteria bacterium QH_10_48_56]PSO60694.1 MAG: ABC transporter ATP-binding protein [Cyanobacteria bacterium QH_7_48_89]PSO78449.1 MAG: ABC transporter ATP-binding protein [Cyanobacteria bacterium QH_3_48_40]PSO93447.1 MAG: ABC transporter ATP-binding protein [Cyanobacteria bacterium QS_9_48_30]PSP01432.1 MAG: ABC transporter ATP-binding protein [Cyanobacteria bacterium SW_7_48_12]PSP14841.1 MAG: ABC transporter ATP-binding protein [Cyanobacteri
MREALFRVENLRVAYQPSSSEQPPTWAVDDVSFTLDSGERLGLVGESGCGKSTLGRASMRLLPTAIIEGGVWFQGQSVLDLNSAQLRQFRGEAVALVFQDPMTRLDPLMTIGEHCIETLQAHQSHLSRKQAKAKAIETLEAVKIPANRWLQYPHEFSGGMRQRVAIALALLLDPKLIVADEPTTSLDVTVASEILQELTRLCQQRGLALLLISHDLAMVGKYCDRLAVMYQGKMVEMGAAGTVLGNPQHEYTRSLLEAALHLQGDKGEKDAGTRGHGDAVKTAEHKNSPRQSLRDSSLLTPLLRVTNLKQHYTLEHNFLQQLFSGEASAIKAVDGVSFALYPGEIFGLVGESGCGKSTLSRAILQLVRPTSGSVEFLEQDLTQLSTSAVRQFRRQMQMVFQDPLACLNPLMKVGTSITEPLLIHELASPAQAKVQVEKMLERVGLTPVADYYQRYPADLSGGQQQRVAIARALITQPQLLICDEPVSMLDASVQARVLALMRVLKEEFNLTYLFITHDLSVARFLCNRIAVMNAGQIVECGSTNEIFNHPQHAYTQKLLQAAPELVLNPFDE